MLMTIAHSVHLEYDFKEHDNNTVCIPRGADEFTDLQEAKRECKKKRYCKGVLNPDCTDQTKYYLCNITAKLVTNTIEQSCFYQKHIIGKKVCYFHFRVYFLVITYHLYIWLIIPIFTANEPSSPSTTPRTTSMSTYTTLTTDKGMYYFCAFANLWLNI